MPTCDTTPGTITVIKNFPDNRILECAVAGGADYLISGDHHSADPGMRG
jgi:predicted nucleic acid-binding protein